MIAPSDINFDPAPVESASDRDFAATDFIHTLQLGMGWFPEHPGGLDRYYYDMLNHLPSANVKVRGLVCGSPEVQQRSLGTVRSAAGTKSTMPGRLLAFRRCTRQDIAEFNPDVIGVHFALYALPLRSAASSGEEPTSLETPRRQTQRLRSGDRQSHRQTISARMVACPGVF